MKNIRLSIRKPFHALLVPLAFFAVFSISGCQPNSSPVEAQGPTIHPITGIVVSVDQAKQIITVDHDEIPGVMEAMVMPFSPADPAALTDVHKGDKISADFSVQANGAVLDNIKILNKE